MKAYLKMSDYFSGDVTVKFSGLTTSIEYDAVSGDILMRDIHSALSRAINSHDELVSKLDVAESTIYEVERVLSEMQRNGAFGLDDVIAEVECCIKRLSQ